MTPAPVDNAMVREDYLFKCREILFELGLGKVQGSNLFRVGGFKLNCSGRNLVG